MNLISSALFSKTLFSEVRYYRKLSQEFQSHLLKNPHDWSKFQNIFNSILDKLYYDILQFEKENIAQFEPIVYKLKTIFEKRYRRYFLHGEFIKRCFEKPFGYSGDFKIIDDIYLNQPNTIGFDRLWDNYFQQLAASEATRKRKVFFKQIILNFAKENKNKNVHIMNLGSGSAREIKELLENDQCGIFSNINFDCYDFEVRAIDYARQILNNPNNVNFFKKNAIRLALKNDITNEIRQDYDMIYSAGLFDYLDVRVATRLLNNLRKILKKNGLMVIANFGDKYSNSSAGWMEWVADWYLIYRTEVELKEIFLNAGFSNRQLKIINAQDKIVNYCFATL